MAANIGHSQESINHWVDRANQMLESRASGNKSEKKNFFRHATNTGRIVLSTSKPPGFEKMTRKEVYKLFLEKTRGAEHDTNVRLVTRKLEEWKSSKVRAIIKSVGTLAPFRKSESSTSQLEISSSSKVDPALTEAMSIRLEIQTGRKDLIETIQATLSQLVAVERSITGNQGVYYLVTSDFILNVPILKLSQEPLKQVLADRIYIKMGFPTPAYAFISKDLTDTASITEDAFRALETMGVAYLKNKIEKQSGSIDTLNVQLQQLQFQLITQRNLLIMNFVEGMPFEALTCDQLIDVLANPKVIRDIGEMIFIDVTINNTDRIHPAAFTCNFGNLLLQNSEASDSERSIALIDHDFRIKEVGSVLEDLEKLIDGKYTAQILENFTYGLQPIFKDNERIKNIIFGSNRNLIEENLQKGFNDALFRLCHVFKNSKMVYALLEDQEKEVEFFLNVLSFMQENLIGKIKPE